MRSLVVLSVFLWSSAVIAEPTARPLMPEVRLGAIVSLTGAAGRNGLNWLEGAELAVEQLNQRGRPTKLIVEDDATTPSKVATAFVKLATADKVSGVIGGTWDFLAETAYPLAQQYRTPFITPTNPVEILSPTAVKNPWIFTNGLSLAAEREVAERFLKQHGVRRISLVYINVPFGTSHAMLMHDAAKAQGAEVVSESEIAYEGFHDAIKLAALRVAREKPDLVFVVLNYEGVDLLMRELESVRSAPMVLMTYALKEAVDFSGSEARYQRAYGIFPKFVSTEFEAAFRKRFGRDPYAYAAAGYDAAMFMSEVALRRSDDGPPKAEFSYAGVTGEHRLPTLSRSVVQTEASILTVRNGALSAIR